MRPIYKKAIIMSAERFDASMGQNSIATDELRAALASSNYSFKEVLGMYKGVSETSFFVEYNNGGALADLNSLASFYDQESILHLDEDRNASLVYCDSDEETKVGLFQAIDKSEAFKLDAYTYCPQLNMYFAVK